MARKPTGSPHIACPFVNANDPRCESRFGLGRLEQAFTVCFGSYRVCPMYHRISEEQIEREDGELLPDAVPVTAYGQALSLRATGT